MVILRGRAAQPVRPGIVTKGVLMGQIPLRTGELVAEAAITDLHGAYKEQIRRENTLRPKATRLRGMTSFSFKTLFKFAQLLNLVELVREEPMQLPPPGGPLYSVRKPDGIHAVVSTRRVFKLTDVGREDEKSWTNLCKAWTDGWSAPQKVEYILPSEQPLVRRRRVKPTPTEKAPTVTPIEWVHRPSDIEFMKLLDHLIELDEIGIENVAVKSETDRLSTLIGGWVVEIEDMRDDAKAINFLEAVSKYTEMLGLIRGVSEALGDRDLGRAIVGLRKLT